MVDLLRNQLTFIENSKNADKFSVDFDVSLAPIVGSLLFVFACFYPWWVLFFLVLLPPAPTAFSRAVATSLAI